MHNAIGSLKAKLLEWSRLEGKKIRDIEISLNGCTLRLLLTVKMCSHSGEYSLFGISFHVGFCSFLLHLSIRILNSILAGKQIMMQILCKHREFRSWRKWLQTEGGRRVKVLPIHTLLQAYPFHSVIYKSFCVQARAGARRVNRQKEFLPPVEFPFHWDVKY